MINWQNGTTPVNENNMNKLAERATVGDLSDLKNTSHPSSLVSAINLTYKRGYKTDCNDVTAQVEVLGAPTANMPSLGGNSCIVLSQNPGSNYDAQLAFGFGADKLAIRRKNNSNTWTNWKYFNNVEDEVYYKVGDSLSFSGLHVANGYITYDAKDVRVIIHTPKKLDKISTINCTALKAEARGILGLLNNTSGFFDFKNSADYTITCTKSNSNSFCMVIRKSSAFSNVNNNTPVSLGISNESEFAFQ